MRNVLLVVLVFGVVLNAFSQETAAPFRQSSFNLDEYGVKITPDKRLIAVKAALEFGGVNANLTEEGKLFSQQLKSDLLSGSEDLKSKIKRFLRLISRGSLQIYLLPN